MSFENTQNTLTSITDIEEVYTDRDIKKHTIVEAAMGPNLQQCLTNVKVDSLDATDKDISEQETFWADHFRKGNDSSALNHSDSTLHENNFNNEDHHESKPGLEKDSFGMNHFGNGKQNKDLGLSDSVVKNNFGSAQYGNGSLDRVESLENEIGMNILIPADNQSKTFSENVDNQRVWSNESQKHLLHLEEHQTHASDDSTPVIFCNNFDQVKFPISHQLQSSNRSNDERCSQQTSLDSLINLDSPTEHVSPSFSAGPGYPRCVTSYDDNSTDELETDAFIANTSTHQESGGSGYNMADHRDSVKYSSKSEMAVTSPVQLSKAYMQHVPKIGNHHGSIGNDIGEFADVSQDTGYYQPLSLDSEHKDIYEQNSLTDKVPSQIQLYLNQQIKTDPSSQHSTGSHIPNLPLATKSSEKSLVSMTTDSSWSDRTSASRHIPAYTDSKPAYNHIQMSCVESWVHVPDVKTTKVNLIDDQHTNIVDI